MREADTASLSAEGEDADQPVSIKVPQAYSSIIAGSHNHWLTGVNGQTPKLSLHVTLRREWVGKSGEIEHLCTWLAPPKKYTNLNENGDLSGLRYLHHLNKITHTHTVLHSSQYL